MNDHYTMLLLF